MQVKVKVKFTLEDLEGECRHSCALSLTLALDGGELSTPCPSCCIPEKETQYPFYKRLSGPQGWSGQLQKILPPPGFDS